MQDSGRAIAYKKAISAINTVTKPIKTEQDVEQLPYIGKRLKCKIKEIIKHGKLGLAQRVKYNEKFQVLQLFSKIWGVGSKTAYEFYNQGFRTLADLR